ncbi:hypothetical protein Tco_0502250 [Tanacetum coccineum]
MTMEILPEPTSNKLCGRSDAYAGNPVKEIPPNLNLPDHRDDVLVDDLKEAQDHSLLCKKEQAQDQAHYILIQDKDEIIKTTSKTEDIHGMLGGTPTDQTKYSSMIGGLMHLTASRPDIAFATFVCARYLARPTEKRLKEVKRIFRYLRQSINKGLWYSQDSGFELIAYSNADLAGCLDDYKSTSGGLQFLGDKLVSWSSKKQDCTTMSTAKPKYVSLSACCAQVIWMRTQLLDYGYCYNKISM